ncbi:hypothetical protein GZH53_04690 [Flavihumibacter sp. R14]|nr:hypothetical protein [Flavihumibacter soli]
MKLLILPLIVISMLVTSCEKQATVLKEISSSESFLPMEIGNYWRNGDDNYTEIQDTVRINNKLFYKFYSLIGGDAISVQYFRLDEHNQLWESTPGGTGKEYLHAKFDARVGDTFFTMNDVQDWNNYKVKLIEKSETKRVFEWDMVYHPNLKGHPHTVTYIKGKGFEGPWQSIRISGVVY